VGRDELEEAMRRVAFALAAAVLGSGCIVSPPPHQDPCTEPYTITLLWSFERQTTTTPVYYGCANADVARIQLYLDDPYDQFGPFLVYDDTCNAAGLEGANFVDAYATDYDYDIRGYDADGVLTFSGSGTAYSDTCNDVLLTASYDDLVVSALTPGTPQTSCGTIDHFDFLVQDYAGTTIDSGTLGCYTQAYSGAPSRPSMDLGAVDLGLLTVSLRAEDAGGGALFSACDATFSHVFVQSEKDYVEIPLANGDCGF
jgi:hypothetical protein